MGARGRGAPPAAAGAVRKPVFSPLERRFAVPTAQGDQLAIRSGRLAQRTETGRTARRLARMLILDHSRSSTMLKALVAPRGVHLPTMPSPIGLWALNRLAADRSTGSQMTFERSFASLQVAAHRQTILLFTEEARYGSHPALRRFALLQLPVLRMHLQLALAAQRAAATASKTD